MKISGIYCKEFSVHQCFEKMICFSNILPITSSFFHASKSVLLSLNLDDDLTLNNLQTESVDRERTAYLIIIL